MRLQNVNPIETAIGTYGRLQSIGLQKEQGERAKENHEMNQKVNQSRLEQIDTQKQDAETQRRNEVAMAALGRQILASENGLEADFTDKELDAMSQNPLFNVDFLMSDEVGQAVDVGDRVMNKEIPMYAPEVGQAITALSPDLQKGSPGKKSVNKVLPGRKPGTVVIDLSVDGVAGKPLTERRSADEDDPVKEIPIEDIMKRQVGVKKMRELLKSEQGRNYLKEVYRQYSGAGKQNSYGEVTQDPVSGLYGQKDSNGQFHVLDARKSGKTGGSASAPSELQIANWLRDENPNLSRQQALSIAKEQKMNLVGEALDLADSIRERQQFMNPGDEGYIDDVDDYAMQKVIRMQDLSRGYKDKSEGGQEQPPIQGARRDASGNWWVEENGKYRPVIKKSENQAETSKEESPVSNEQTSNDSGAKNNDPRVDQIDSQIDELQTEMDAIEEAQPPPKRQGLTPSPSDIAAEKEYYSSEKSAERKQIKDKKKEMKEKIEELNDIKKQIAKLDSADPSDEREQFLNQRKRERLVKQANKYGIDINNIQNIAQQ